jgi:hypothetical protein
MEPTPSPLPGGAHQVDLDTFVARVAPPGQYRDFDEMLATLAGDPFENEVVEGLVAELAEHGRFRSPIRVNDGSLANGCHRFAAAVRSGSTLLDVWVVDDDHPDPEWVDAVPMVELTVRVAGDDVSALFDLFVNASRSFRLTADVWVEGEGQSGCGNEFQVWLYVDAAHADAAVAAVLARLADAGVEAELLGARLTDTDHLDD